MTFDEVLTQIIDLLKRQGRVSYRALKMRFNLDDEYLDVLKEELIDAQRIVSLRRPCLTSDQHEQSGHSWHSGILPICMGATPH